MFRGKALSDQETDLGGGYAAANRVRSAVEVNQVDSSGIPQTVTISCGVAEYQKEQEPRALIDRAYRALSAAKEAGRNRVYVEADGEARNHV